MNERKQRLLAEQEVLKLKYEGLDNKLRDHEKRTETETKIAQELLEKKAEEYTLKFRDRIKQKDEQLFNVKVIIPYFIL